MDKYQTDLWIMDGLFGACDDVCIWRDPCPIGWDMATDPSNLEKEWNHERYFINPPYSNPLPWVKKAIESHQKYGSIIVMLLKHDSSTQWYRLLHEARAHMMLIVGRLDHRTGKKAAFPSMMAVLY